MKVWLLKCMGFGLLWGCLLWMQYDSSNWPFLLLFCALTFTIYFFIPASNHRLWLCIILQITLYGLMWLDIPLIWVCLLSMYGLIESLSLLSYKQFRTVSFISFLLFISVFMLKSVQSVPLIAMMILFLWAVLLQNSVRQEREDQKKLYQQLLSEYRQLKRMHVENEEVVRLEERTRIAREIHDSVGHKLTALLMQLEIYSLEKTEKEYASLKELAVKSLEETRHAVKTLHSHEIVGISSVLQLIRKLEAENHLQVRFTTKEGVLLTPLTNERSVVLYRSIQEALTNAMKYASSRSVSVTLGNSAIGELEWQVINDIEQAQELIPGFGLTSMKERVQDQGGKLRFYQTDEQFYLEGSMPVVIEKK